MYSVILQLSDMKVNDHNSDIKNVIIIFKTKQATAVCKFYLSWNVVTSQKTF